MTMWVTITADSSLYRRLLILKLLGSLQHSANTLSPQMCSIDIRYDILNKGCTYKHL